MSRTVLQLTAKLESNGWRVETSQTPDKVTIQLAHDLTSGLTLVYLTSAGMSFPDFVTRALQRREFEILANPPEELRAAALIGGIRVAGQVNRWDADTISVIADVLARHGVLSEGEAEWLDRAGIAWSDEPTAARAVRAANK